jgi:hypothetical protein
MAEQKAVGGGEGAAILGALARLEARLSGIEGALARVTGIAAHAEPLTAALVDSFDDAAAQLSTRGVDVDERLRAALSLAERLTAPETVRAVELALTLAQQLPGFVAAAVDSFDDTAARLGERGIDVDARTRGALSTLEGLTSPAMIAATHALLEAEREPPARIGMFGLLGALRNPDVQRALGLAVRVAERVGAALPDGSVPRLPARSTGEHSS